MFELTSDLGEIYWVGTHDQGTSFIASLGLLDILIIVTVIGAELDSNSFEKPSCVLPYAWCER